MLLSTYKQQQQRYVMIFINLCVHNDLFCVIVSLRYTRGFFSIYAVSCAFSRCTLLTCYNIYNVLSFAIMCIDKSSIIAWSFLGFICLACVCTVHVARRIRDSCISSKSRVHSNIKIKCLWVFSSEWIFAIWFLSLRHE